MRNGLFISPGVRINEIDQSIVPDLYSEGRYNILIFIQSDWGPNYQFIQNGSKEFIKYFGQPSTIDSISKISYDQQYRLSGQNCNLWVFRLNQSDDPMDMQYYELDLMTYTYIPITQRYSGIYGNTIKLKFYNSGLKNIYVTEIYTQISLLNDPMLKETFTQRSLEELIILVNKSSILVNFSQTDMTSDVWAELVTTSHSDYVNLSDGNNSDRISPEDYITEILLENNYEIKFTFLVTQGQLTSVEVNRFIELQYKRKDFIILHELMPENDEYIYDDIIDEYGIPAIGWKRWFRFITDNIELIGTQPGYTNRYVKGLSQSYLQIYNPWVIDTTTANDFIPYPPSVHAMEVFLSAIRNGGEIWDQMQGLNRGNISNEPMIILTKTDSDVLYINNINPIVKFQGQGTYVWGQKTHYMRNSQLSRLNQRMVAIYVENGIQEKMRRFLFEPMEDSTFSAIRTAISIFMNNVQDRHGIIGYEYELDIRPEFIERNYLPIKIRFIPTKTLEFIEIRFVVKNYSQQL